MDVETRTTLLPSTHNPPRRWARGICCCLGDGDLIGWASCILAANLPCYAWAVNTRRMHSHANLWYQAAIYFAFFSLCSFLVNMAQTRYWAEAHVEVREDAHGKRPYFVLPAGDYIGEMSGWTIMISLFTLLSLVLAIMGSVVAARRRQEMRTKLGISHDPNDKCDSAACDCCKWFCCGCCTLAQETRTLWAKNVERGVWHGPPKPQLQTAMTPPTPLEGMV